MGRRPEALRVQSRSVIPGRQRWDVEVVLGRPRVAEILEARLRGSPGMTVVRANPVTGRLLVFHDAGLSGAEVGRRIREAVALVVSRLARRVARASAPAPGAVPARGAQRWDSGALAFTVAAGAGGAWVAGSVLRRSPVSRLGAVVLTTGIIIRRAWRRSRRSHEGSTRPHTETRHPLLEIVGPQRKKFYQASFLSVLGQLLDMAPAVPISVILLVLTTGSSATLTGLGLAGAAAQLWFLATATAVLFAAAAAVSYRSGVVWRELAQSVQHEWRTETYAHLQRVQLRYLEDERTSRLAGLMTDDVNQLGRFFAASANDLIQTCTGFLVLVPVFLIFSPTVAWIALLPVPIIAWLSFSHNDRVRQDYATNSENESLLNSQLINNLEAGATIKSFGAEAYEIDRIHQLSERYRRSSHQIDSRTTAYAQLVRLCTMSSLAGFLLGGGLDVLRGALSFEAFNALLGLPNIVLWKLPALGGAVDQYQQTVAALKRVRAVHRLPVETQETGRELDVGAVTGELVLDRVTFGYPGRRPVLRDLSLRIAAGQTTGIVGVTGAGKTTIAKLLLRLQDVSAGRVLLDGHDIRQVRLLDLRAAIGFVAQDAFLFDGTVNDNITYGSFGAGAERVENAARLADADGFIQTLPQRYDTMTGERGAALSGGQKQRLSLARAIVKDAPILILDEATSAVDNETEMAIHHALGEFSRNRTLVVIAHRLSTIRHADWIYVLGDGGVVAEQGTHQELLKREGVYASLWRLQIGEVSA